MPTIGKAVENFSGMSAEAWRMAAERHEALGHRMTALMFRNEAYVLEHPEETWFKVKKN